MGEMQGSFFKKLKLRETRLEQRPRSKGIFAKIVLFVVSVWRYCALDKAKTIQHDEFLDSGKSYKTMQH